MDISLKNDRKIKTVKQPPARPLEHHLLFPSNSSSSPSAEIPNWSLLRSHLHGEGMVEKAHVKTIIEETNKILSSPG